MVGLKIAYQNVGGGSDNGNTFLEWCGKLDIDICFIGEAWRNNAGMTQFRTGYTLFAGRGKVVAYVKEELKGAVKVRVEEERVVVLEANKNTIAGVYAPAGGGKEELQEWLNSWGDAVKEGILIGDWNAHHYDWDKEREDAKGKLLKEWTELKGYQLVEPDDITFHRQVRGQLRTSTIDLVFTSNDNWLPEPSEAITADHKVIWGHLDNNIQRDLSGRQVIDWTKFLGDMNEIRDEWEADEQTAWTNSLEGNTAYGKVIALRRRYLKTCRIGDRSKKWWTEDIDTQLKIVREAARGGKGLLAREHDGARWKRWRNERRKMERMIRESKAETWRKFLEENGEKDPWDVVRLAKNPWGRQGQGMKDITDEEGRVWHEDSDKVQAISARNFGWNNEGRCFDHDFDIANIRNTPAANGDPAIVAEMAIKVRTALSGTSSSSSPGPDGISYRFIKAIKDTTLGDMLFQEIGEVLATGIIPYEWQESKVVMIPKPGKDHQQVKGWRPINLINCIGKLSEKVVADHLQEAGVFHRWQFGSVKGRSATEAVFRQVVRAQRCLEKGGRVGWGMWDVKGGFGNSREAVVRSWILERSPAAWQRWGTYVENFFRPRKFLVEWDGKTRGQGVTNIGVPQGSPLSPVIFLIYMAPILHDMEQQLASRLEWRGKRLDLELPSYVDDIMASLMDWDGRRDMSRVLTHANSIITEVATRWELPLEQAKTEKLVLKKKRKRGKPDYVKWLGVILDETLTFDLHWKSRIDKARKLLGAFNSIGNSQYGISPRSWRQLYTGMVRVVALWGSELGWRGQKQFITQLQKLQYQALRRATGAITGASQDKVNKISCVEDVETTLDATQQRFMARAMSDPSKVKDLFTSVNQELGRHWTDNMMSRVQEEQQGRDGYTSVLSRAMGKSLLEEEQISWGQTVPITEVQVIKISTLVEDDQGNSLEMPLDKNDTPARWQLAISKHQQEGTRVFYSDGSLDNGQVGAGWFGSTFGGGSISAFDYVGERATVWDGEIRGISGALQCASQEQNILILADSQAALAAVKKAGKTGKARTRELANVIRLLRDRQDKTTKLGWVKSHIGIEGNETADKNAKKGTLWRRQDQKPWVTEGGLRQHIKQIRAHSRGQDLPGYGKGRVLDWNRKATTTYTHLRTNKGPMRAWLNKIGKVDSPTCSCGEADQTGDHVMFSCKEWKHVRKGWRSWEDIDNRWKSWLLPHKNEKGEVEWVENLVETFCTRVQLAPGPTPQGEA